MKYFAFIFLIIFVLEVSAQGEEQFDQKLESLARKLADKISENGKQKVAVWGFSMENGDISALSRYITEDFSIYITNFSKGYQVVDRTHLDVILREHNLGNKGLIDQNTAKELGKIIAVDAIITGTITILDGKIKARAKVLDTETALQFAAYMDYLPINSDVATYTGSIGGGSSKPTNRGTNRPLNSNESYNYSGTVSTDCKELNTGDFCFENKSDKEIWIGLRYEYQIKNEENDNYKLKDERKEMVLKPGESQCFYSILSTFSNYFVVEWENYKSRVKSFNRLIYDDNSSLRGKVNSAFSEYLEKQGEIKIEKCKSKTFVIK